MENIDVLPTGVRKNKVEMTKHGWEDDNFCGLNEQ
jgi:hypothetical protein